MTYHIEVLGPTLVRIYEDVVSYPMTKAQALENLETVKSHRSEYANDDVYLRRVNFYLDVLNSFSQENEHGNAKPRPH